MWSKPSQVILLFFYATMKPNFLFGCFWFSPSQVIFLFLFFLWKMLENLRGDYHCKLNHRRRMLLEIVDATQSAKKTLHCGMVNSKMKLVGVWSGQRIRNTRCFFFFFGQYAMLIMWRGWGVCRKCEHSMRKYLECIKIVNLKIKKKDVECIQYMSVFNNMWDLNKTTLYICWVSTSRGLKLPIF